MPVQGIGGLFFRARDPAALSAWYSTHLSVGAGCDATGTGASDAWSWNTAGGQVMFAPFDADTDYFATDRAFMLNFRVTGLDALLETLRAQGVAVITNDAWDDPATGRFARIHDPEGNPIELWEPPTA